MHIIICIILIIVCFFPHVIIFPQSISINSSLILILYFLIKIADVLINVNKNFFKSLKKRILHLIRIQFKKIRCLSYITMKKTFLTTSKFHVKEIRYLATVAIPSSVYYYFTRSYGATLCSRRVRDRCVLVT